MSTIKIASMSALMLLLSACATQQTTPGEGSAEERAQQRWDAVLAQDWSTVRQYHTPGFRQRQNEQQFAQNMRQRPLRWTGAEVVGSDCDGDRCAVKTRVSYQLPPSAPGHMRDLEMDTYVDQDWIRLDGQWWYVAE